jgi:hypothetical protein
MLRNLVKHIRPIAIYLQERTVMRMHAPGGSGRRRDYDAFVEDNMFR